jgi:O-acetyl-ADP-ribose deacetylase (regulator of RNase III)
MYERACRAHDLHPGAMLVFETGRYVNPKYIINFPTKRHWKGKSKIEDIESGLVALVDEITRREIKSVAVPPLGCGNGGLDWEVIRRIIITAFEQAPNVRVLLYAPIGAPDAKTMPVRTDRPKMTVARALLTKLMEQYCSLAYRLTLLEIQKLGYFAQEAGEPLKLNYQRGHYGPFAPNLNQLLGRIEGHFIRGLGDSPKRDQPIELLSGATNEAELFLEEFHESQARLTRVAELIEGFETPYGMELLSSVHWVAIHEESKAQDAEAAIAAIHGWTSRKERMFKPNHIRIAWDRLLKLDWLASSHNRIKDNSEVHH